ncbi:MAG: DUF3426 domain-containing protein [Actinomycetota bacterium]
MIIECKTCHARFRLDESRIKGRGARVRCRKCGDGIVVMKGGPATPPAAGEAGFFDLGSAVRDSLGESPSSPSPVGNLIPFPVPPRSADSTAPEFSRSAPEASAPARDEVDLAFDRVLSAGTDASSPSSGETAAEIPSPGPHAGVPADHEPPDAPGGRTDFDFGGLTLDLGPEEKLDLPSPEPEPPIGEASAVRPPGEFRAEGGFLISDSDTLDFLQEKYREGGSESPPAGVGDISLEISPAPADEAGSFPRGSAASKTPFEDWASPTPGEISVEGNVTPPAAEPAIDIPPYREAESVPGSPAEPVMPAAHIRSPAPEFPRQRSSVGAAVAAVVAVLFAAGGYLGFTTSGRKTLERAVPGVAALWGGNPAEHESPAYDLRSVIGYYESGIASPRILVIKGQVANLSKVEKSGIRIKATLLDNTDAVLAQQAVFAGNVLSGEAIRKESRDTLSKALENRFGGGLANMNVGPGKTIPFMVVFFDAPTNMDTYKLEAKDSE